MKKLCLMLGGLLLFPAIQDVCFGDDWTLINSDWKSSVKFVSENVGWSGLWRTKDGGLSWQDTYPEEYESTDPYIPGSPKLNIRDVEPVTDSLAFFICQQFSNWESRMTALYWTKNCGDKWYRKYYSDEIDFGPYYAQIFFLNETVGWFSIPGYYNCQDYYWGELHKTDNAGESFNFIACSTIPTRALQFVDDTVGWAIERDLNSDGINYLYKTVNGGNVWNSVYASNSSLNLTQSSDPKFVSQNCGWLIDQNNQIRRTLDGGANWTFIPKSGIDSITCLHPFDADKIWIGASNGIFYSDNGGLTWMQSSARAANSIYFLSENMGWTTGADGLFKYAKNPSFTKACNLGWNLISCNVVPSNPDLSSLLTPLESHLIIMKNGGGQVYWPSLGIDQIGTWDILDGYQLYLNAPDTLSVAGEFVDPESEPISLIAGWNMISYLRTSSMAIESALASISAYLVITKSGLGTVYWPSLGINTIGEMQPGNGYVVFVNQACILNYAPNAAP